MAGSGLQATISHPCNTNIVTPKNIFHTLKNETEEGTKVKHLVNLLAQMKLYEGK